MTGVEDAIGRVSLFERLSERDRKDLAASFKERTFPAGTVVTEVGQDGIGFFIITEGTATVVAGGKPRRTLGAGDYFGEIALIDQGTRTAQITADTDLHCFGLVAWDFRPYVQSRPDVAWALLEAMAKRVREAEARAESAS
jgi:CRP/FNR family cyclic AMP-dependent transcriptional regulator